MHFESRSGFVLNRTRPAGARWVLVGVLAVAFLNNASGQQAVGAKPPSGAVGNVGKARIHDDPREDGWLTEQLARRTDKTLKKWAAHLSATTPPDVKELEHYVAPEFEIGRLRPDELDVAYDQANFRVLRPAEGAVARAHSRDRRGAAGFAASLAELLAPMEGATSRRFSIKTIFVHADETPLRTWVRIEALAKVPRGTLQQISYWNCLWRLPPGEEPGLLESITLDSFEEVEGRGTTGTLFADCTLAVMSKTTAFERQLQIGSEEWLARMDTRLGYDTRGHQGVAIGDADGDGLDDVYICQAGGLPNRLFLHQADGTVKDVSQEAGVDWVEPTHGALFLDLDRDGDQDLVIGTGFELMLMANDGRGKFSRGALLKMPRPTISLAAADVDNDGDVDLYAGVFHDAAADPGKLAHPIPLHDANNGGRNILFRNDTARGGEFKFVDATAEFGLEHNNTKWTWGVCFEDYDNDGDQDLYVANDFGANNLYRNDGGRFHDVAEESGCIDRSFGMGCAWGDIDRDGWMDLYVSNMWSSAGHRITYQPNFKPELASEEKSRFQFLARGNSLYRNRGDGRFVDASVETATTLGRWAWGCFFLDANNDAFEDILVCNGYLTNTEPEDL
ncbi:MAG: VCBS repeat-containing protein [Planctomycetes bacterium]|nr:VCBS repeat-containing protein [Planctomycetota bacterium]